jgi:DNA-binding Xre family transcriptional regulator
MTIRNKIKRFLAIRGTTVYRFWKDTGIAKSTAYDLVATPERIPDASVLEKLCGTYKVQPSEFLEWVPDTVESKVTAVSD